jgi:SARP family transcriptional regulator, regulator of embCAB operon
LVKAAPVNKTCGVTLGLLGGFRFVTAEGYALSLPEGSQRLLAFLALRGGAVTRPCAAGVLWPESTDDRAFASLRSALSRMTLLHRESMLVGQHDLCLANGVRVDVRGLQTVSERLIDPGCAPAESDLSTATVAAFSQELLPGWYDDWVLVAAEQWRQLRLHALEALVDRLAAAGRYGEAISAALAAIQSEPLRESAHAALVRVHLAEGNQSEALRAFQSYSSLLQRELGLQPTSRIQSLVLHLRPANP